MRAPLAWLKEYCDPGLDAVEVGRLLSMSGTELERITRVGVPSDDGNASYFRIGKVLSAERHPEADRLSVCSVQLSGSDTRTIVCGAPNVAAGETVLVALPGAVMPGGGTKLGRADLRGVTSEGMILSEAELEIGTDTSGIVVLPDSYEAGEPAGGYLSIGDDVLELEVNPNRPDCMSVYGVARELHAVTGAALSPDPGAEDVAAEGDGGAAEHALSVSVEDFSLCPRFTVRVFEEVRIGPSPLWLKARLMTAGQRPINNVVDITNYVMLVLGQPMHAYDLDRLAGPELRVRRAKEGERLTTLDGEQRVFDDDAVLVCDGRGPVGIGGIMGGAESEVSEGTTRVAMEAATWNGPNILKTSSKLSLRTEASARFERRLHPELAVRAQRLAARLMVDLAGARMQPGTIDAVGEVPPPTRLRLRLDRLERLLGDRIEADEAAAILERLGFGVERSDDALDVEVPYFRHYDVTREADLIEEVARMHGVDKLPSTLPARERAVGGLTRDQKRRRLAQDLLRGRGLSEIVPYSFISPRAIEQLRLPAGDEQRRVLHIANPLSEEQSAMRTTLLPGMLGTARYNIDRGIRDLRLFEAGRVFYSNGPDRLPEEQLHLGVLLAGAFQPATWRSPERRADFYAVKALLVSLLEVLRVDWRLADGGPAFLHPGRAAEVLAGGHEAGWLGELNPLVASSFGLDEPPAVMELDLEVVLAAAADSVRYEDLISVPAVFQDIAVVVDEAVEAQTVVDTVRAAAGPELRNVTVFDLYRGEQVGEGRKSVALRLEFRAADRTLTDDEVGGRRERIKEALARHLEASLRE